MTRTRWLVILGAAVLLAIAARLALVRWQGQSGLAEIRRRGTLRIGLDASFPPFESLDADGAVVGLDADIARAIATDLGVRAEFVNIGFDGLYDALKIGRVDAVISGLPIDPLRTRDVAYSTPYFNAGQMLITTRPDVQSVADVAGKTVAVEWGSMAELAARKLKESVPDVTISPQPDAETALNADLAVVDGVLRLNRPQARTVAVLDDNWYAVAVNIENSTLLAEINRTLDAIKNSQSPCGLAVPPSEFSHSPNVESCYAR